MNYHHWHIKTDQEHLTWLYLDRQGASANTLNVEVLEQLDAILEDLAGRQDCRGVIIASAKPSGFIMGADIEQFTKVADFEQGYQFIVKVQAIFNKLERLKIPTVAMIEGFCLGGGTELALACRYRVVEESRQTRIGLPEVKLGIHPGWGGMIRAPRLMGGIKAMDLILSGRMIDGKKAYYMGFAQAAVPKRHLKAAASMFALKQPKVKSPLTIMDKISNYWPIRLMLAQMMKKRIALKASIDHYPAPYAALRHFQQYGGTSSKSAFDAEAKSVAQLITSEVAQNLIRVFFLQDRMKKLAKHSTFRAKHVHVIGAGTMGGDIAAWCAYRGMTVTLEDRDAKYLAPAIMRAQRYFKKRLKKPRLITQVMDRLIPDTKGHGIARADVVIEAIFESLEAKQQLLQRLEKTIKADAIIASNTSSIPLEDMASALALPEKLVGIHFFNPVAMMPLVEVVYGKQTASTIVDNALAFVGQLGKQPVAVKSSPGFLVNRCLMPYLLEAVELLSQGAKPVAIDRAALYFGMPMGPIELADTVGLDVCLQVAKNLTQHYGGRVPDKLVQLVDAGKLGKKTGQGFYKFVNGKAVKEQTTDTKPLSEIIDRLILRMINECAACLREGIIDDADLLDAGMIFGTGFAPFRGGPMHYAKKQGINVIIERLKRYQDQCGKRFKADDYWLTMTQQSDNE